MLGREDFAWIAEAEAKTDEAVALSNRIIEWFYATYEDPAYVSAFYADGYPGGELYDARTEISGHFYDELTALDERDAILDAVVDEIEEDGVTEWRERGIWDVDEDDHLSAVPLLRAHDHRWGKGHVHFFVVVRPYAAKSWRTAPAMRSGGRRRHHLQGVPAPD